MDSPDRNLTATAAEVQGSPLFNFLCSLSPIKPAKSHHVAQTYSELTFPPPPPVFVSPRVDLHKVSSRNTSTGSAIVDQGKSRSLQMCIERDQTAQLVKSSKCPQEQYSSPCSSPSKLILEYLADSVDDMGYEECTKDSPPKAYETELIVTMKMANKQPATTPGNENECVPSGSGRNESRGFKSINRVSSSVQTCSVGHGKVESEAIDEEPQMMENSPHFENEKESRLLEHADIVGYEGNKALEINQEADVFLLLMPDRTGKLSSGVCLDDWTNDDSESEFPMQQVTTYMSELRGFIDDDGQEVLIDDSIGPIANQSLNTCDFVHQGSVSQTRPNVQGQPICNSGGTSVRGVRRRCLDFEDSEGRWNVSQKPVRPNPVIRPQNILQSDASAKIPMSVLKERVCRISGATNSESTEELQTSMQTSTRSCNTKLRVLQCSSLQERGSRVKLERQLSDCSRFSGMSPCVPLGIGLHLNSLAGSMLSHSSKEAEMKCTSSSPLATLLESPPEDYTNGVQARSPSLSLRRGVIAPCMVNSKNLESDLESRGSVRISSAKKFVVCAQPDSLGMQQLNELASADKQSAVTSPAERKRALLTDVLSQPDVEGENQSPRTLKKKRKLASTTEKNGDGCKRCNCKKSKCLKLYCECFAAGVYCVDSCTCNSCLNKREFEDTVVETRQQIESRNPLAFAPKIVRATDSSPTNGDECGDAPASARHKRGCNCKKSQCLKKYCECYQAGVGCSDGCRCEGCKNLFGRKEGFEGSENKDDEVKVIETEIVEEQLDSSELCNGSSLALLHEHSDLSPITPALQGGGQSRLTVKSSSADQRLPASDEFHPSGVSLSSAKPSRSPSRLLRSSKGSQNNSIAVSARTPVHKIAGSPISTPKMLRIRQFSPRWNGLTDICTLTPLPHAPTRPTPASVSLPDGLDSSPSFTGHHCSELSSSGHKSVKNVSKTLCNNSPCPQRPVSRPSIMSQQSETDRQNTPTTSMFSSSIQGTDIQLAKADEGAAYFIKGVDPEWSPICALKTSSPRQKRVSPPHNHDLSHRVLHSPGLRSGRKFIFQSILSSQHSQVSESGSLG